MHALEPACCSVRLVLGVGPWVATCHVAQEYTNKYAAKRHAATWFKIKENSMLPSGMLPMSHSETTREACKSNLKHGAVVSGYYYFPYTPHIWKCCGAAPALERLPPPAAPPVLGRQGHL